MMSHIITSLNISPTFDSPPANSPSVAEPIIPRSIIIAAQTITAFMLFLDMRSLVSDTLTELTTPIETEPKPALRMFSASVLKLLESPSSNASANPFLHLFETLIHEPGSPMRHLAFTQLQSVHCSQPPDLRSRTALLTTKGHCERSTPAANRLACTRANLCLECSGMASLTSSICSLMLDVRSLGFKERPSDMSLLPLGILELSRRRKTPVPVTTSATSGDDPRVRVMPEYTRYLMFRRCISRDLGA